ncbi:MAG: FkbM family methyltransferase [Planctomycetaceae bacterium]
MLNTFYQRVRKRILRSHYRSAGSYPLQIEGRHFDCDGEHARFWHRLEFGIWEPQTFRILSELLTPESCYWDVGAWIGPTVLYASMHCQQVFAFEPDPVAYQFLQQNVTRNHLANVTLMPDAVAAETGTLKIGPRKDRAFGNSNSSLLWSDSPESVPVKAWTPQDLILNRLAKIPDVIKIDIEGGEFGLVPEMQSFLQVHRPAVYLSLHAPWIEGTDRDRQAAIEKVSEVFSNYPYCYDESLQLCSPRDIAANKQTQTGFTAYVFSPRPLFQSRKRSA